MPSRTEFQQLADVRVAEAQALLKAGLWDGAYYVAGYAIEFGLKACIAKLIKAEEYPPRKTDEYYNHDVGKLVKTAKLDALQATMAKGDPEFSDNWTVVTRWSEGSRYERKSEAEARELFNAITDGSHGVLPWIKLHW